MELSKQVVSLELAQKLKELGVKQESLFYWDTNVNPASYVGGTIVGKVAYRGYIKQTPNEMEKGYRYFAAFTAAELGEMLPYTLDTKSGETHSLQGVRNMHGKWFLEYSTGTFQHEQIPLISDMSEADARAKMLIYLLENHLI